jgi:DNA-binding CsgD family transcriptional regulator
MKPLAEVVAEHISGVLAAVSGAAVVMSVRAYRNPDERRAYQAGASDVLTAVALGLGLRAEFAPMLLGAPLTVQDWGTKAIPAPRPAHLPRALGGGVVACSSALAGVPESLQPAAELSTIVQRPLTAEEREVAECIAAGQSSRELAEALRLDKTTVMTHRGMILFKTGVIDAQGLTTWLRANPAPTDPEPLTTWLRANPAPTDPEPLTLREKEVARLIAVSKSNEQIAEALKIPFVRARAHRANIYKRLRVHCVAELLQHRELFEEGEAVAPAVVCMTETEGAIRNA